MTAMLDDTVAELRRTIAELELPIATDRMRLESSSDLCGGAGGNDRGSATGSVAIIDLFRAFATAANRLGKRRGAHG